MLTTDYIVEQMKVLLPIYSNTYDAQLKIIVSGAINKLKNEGVTNEYEENTNDAFDYIMCIAYQVAMDMDFDVDINRMRQQYLSRVNTLRCGRKSLQYFISKQGQ